MRLMHFFLAPKALAIAAPPGISYILLYKEIPMIRFDVLIVDPRSGMQEIALLLLACEMIPSSYGLQNPGTGS
uniref:Putative secreted protein n=1 Tax=Xenopsylla cheopis TaxID=163159 RepID=A0A6M2DXE3_XENCH